MINLTEPLLPNKNDLYKLIDNIYESKHLTNRGSLHEKYNILVKEYLGVKYSFPFVNGHSALVSAIKSLEINNSEIITSAFTYCSSTISILETNNIPVFVDVDEFGNIDTQKIEEKINTKTKAILAIHVFGEPCNIKKLEYIARKYNLYLIFDAAHAFGIKVDNIGIGNFGNISMFSTHATKIFNTIEGGLLTYKNVEYDRIIKSSTTFGLNETNDNTIMLAGNNKMNEFQSAFGILNLNEIDNSIIKRKNTFEIYKNELNSYIEFLTKYNSDNILYNYSYCVIKTENRNKLYLELLKNEISSRKYFYPLTSKMNISKSLKNEYLKNSENLSEQCLSIPFHQNLTEEQIYNIIKIIKENA